MPKISKARLTDLLMKYDDRKGWLRRFKGDRELIQKLKALESKVKDRDIDLAEHDEIFTLAFQLAQTNPESLSFKTFLKCFAHKTEPLKQKIAVLNEVKWLIGEEKIKFFEAILSAAPQEMREILDLVKNFNKKLLDANKSMNAKTVNECGEYAKLLKRIVQLQNDDATPQRFKHVLEMKDMERVVNLRSFLQLMEFDYYQPVRNQALQCFDKLLNLDGKHCSNVVCVLDSLAFIPDELEANVKQALIDRFITEPDLAEKLSRLIELCLSYNLNAREPLEITQAKEKWVSQIVSNAENFGRIMLVDWDNVIINLPPPSDEGQKILFDECVKFEYKTGSEQPAEHGMMESQGILETSSCNFQKFEKMSDAGNNVSSYEA